MALGCLEYLRVLGVDYIGVLIDCDIKVPGFLSLNLLVGFAIQGFYSSVRPYDVTGRQDCLLAFVVDPVFMPNPSVLVQTKKVTVVIFWNWAKDVPSEL